MTKEQFAEAHAEICSKKHGKQSKHRCPSHRKKCGLKLYKFLTENNLPLDICFNQKKFIPR